MNFSEQPASKQWAALKYRGESVAEVWFKPEGEPFALEFRIPQRSFQVPGIGQQLTTEHLLKAVGISAEEVESWRHEGAPDSGMNGSNSELGHPLPRPTQDVAHLNLYISLKPPAPAVAPKESDEPKAPESMVETTESILETTETKPETLEAKWQYLEGRWNAILGAEAGLESLRLNMEGLRAEMDAAAKKALSLPEKLHALSADVVLWNRGKSRIRYVVPKLKEFVHRAIWATGIPERKAVEEYFENHVRPRIPLPEMDQVIAKFDSLLKNRQILSAQGASVYAEGRSILAEVEGALRTLQRNSAANAGKKRSESRTKGKFF